MKISSARKVRSWLWGGLLLLVAPFSVSQAAMVAVDSLLINYASLTVAITGGGTTNFAGPVTPPVNIDMGTYQDPIVQMGGGLLTAKIYSSSIGGMPAPSGFVDTTANTVSVDFSSLRASATIGLRTYDFAIPLITNPPTAGSYNPGSGAYTLLWSDPFSVSFGTQSITGIATVSLMGTATLVPVPAAVWLLGSGLVGLAGIARRRAGRGSLRDRKPRDVQATVPVSVEVRQ